MENQPIINPSDISSINPPVNQPSIPPQIKSNLMMPILTTLLVSAVLFGVGGYYLGAQSSKTNSSQQQMEVSPSPYVTASPTSQEIKNEIPNSATGSWQLYTDAQLKFSLSYPDTYKLDYLQGQPYLNRVITWHVNDMLVKDQRGDGPIVQKEEIVSIPVVNTSRFSLEFGSVGGNIPHEEVWYQFANPHSTSAKDKYITIRLSSIPVLMTDEEINQYSGKTDTQKLNTETTKVFDQIVSILKLQ